MDQKTLRYIIEFDAKYAERLKGILKKTKQELDGVDGSMTRTSAATKGLSNNMARLMGRAMMVIPVWIALRNIFLSFVNTIREGIQHIKEFDKAMARAIAVTHGIKDIETFARGLKNEIRALSIETGESVDKIAEAYYRFGTAGVEGKEALDGMKLAIKTSIAIMGDSTQTARTLADVYNLMKNNIRGVTSTTQAMQKIASTMAVLWTNNAFELNEFNAALKTVTGVAKNFDLTLDELLPSLAVSHTLMQRGGTAGSQLARSWMMMTRHIERVNNALGRTVDLSKDRIFDVFLELLRKLNDEYTDGASKAKALFDIFGMKGAKVTASLAANFEKWAEQLEIIQKMPLEQRMKKLNDLFELQMNTIDRQLKRFRELKQVTMEYFVIGLTGTEDYVTALKTINDFIQNTLMPTVVTLGVVLRRSLGAIVDIATAIQEKGIAGAAREEIFARPETQRQVAMFGKFKAGRVGYVGYVGKPGTPSPLAEEFKKEILAPFQEARGRNDVVRQMEILTQELGFAERKAMDLLDPIEEAAYTIIKLNVGVRTFSELMDKIEGKTESTVDHMLMMTSHMSLVTQSLAYQLQQTELMKIFGYDEVEIAEERVRLAMKDAELTQNKKKVTQEILKLQKAMNTEIIKYSTTLQNAFKNAFSEFLKGKTSLSKAFKGIVETMGNVQIEALSEGLVGKIFKDTGIGAIFGASTSQIKRMFSSPIERAFMSGGETAGRSIYNWMRRAGLEIAGGQVVGEGGVAGAGGGGILGLFGGGGGKGFTLPGFGKGGFWSRPISAGAGAEGMTWGGWLSRVFSYVGIASALSQTKYEDPSSFTTPGGRRIGRNIGAPIQFAGVSLFPEVRKGFTAKEQNISNLMYYADPLGIFKQWWGQTPKRQEENVEEEIKRVASKIDISNQHLQWVNRNLVALRQELTYIMPRSYYFKERTPEEQFSISSGRGTT